MRIGISAMVALTLATLAPPAAALVSWEGPSDAVLVAGDQMLLRFSIYNREMQPAEVLLRAEAPQELNVAFHPESFTIGPLQREGVTVSLRAAAGTAPSVVHVTLVARSVGYRFEDLNPADVEVTIVAPADLPESSSLDAPAAGPPSTLRHLGLAAASLALAAILMRRSWTLAVALYSRVRARDALEHPRRRLIYEAIRHEPGVYTAELVRETGLRAGVVRHHLRHLEATGHIRSRIDGRKRRYAAADAEWTDIVRRPLTLMQQRVLALIEDEARTAGELAPVLNVTRQAAHLHLLALSARGLAKPRRRGRQIEFFAEHASSDQGTSR